VINSWVFPLALGATLTQYLGYLRRSIIIDSFGKNMKRKSLLLLPVFAFVLFLSTLTAPGKTQQPAQPKVSGDEAKALNAINAAPDAAAKMTGAEEFVKKHPKSAAMPMLAEQLAMEIGKVSDVTQKLALADRFEKAFTDEKSLQLIQFTRMDAYLASNKVDEAYALAAKILAKDPEELHTMIQMIVIGTETVKKGNTKYAPQTLQYGLKAIELIEANKKPAQMDETTWTNDKGALPQLYQQTAILSMVGGNTGDAKARLEKAAQLNPQDPSNHAFTGYILNNEYVQQATMYKSMPDGKQKEEMLKKLEGLMDGIIDEFAKAVGLASGRAEYQPLVQQITPDLTSYYKYRHNQSVEGLQQLIDKYKPK
jgi:Flp pilus assembly protein TadD